MKIKINYYFCASYYLCPQAQHEAVQEGDREKNANRVSQKEHGVEDDRGGDGNKES